MTIGEIIAECIRPAQWGSPAERETKRRVRVAVAAYAYEVEAAPIMSDAEFDELAAAIDLTIDTTRPAMDKWFRENFEPHTGQWVLRHPDIDGLRRTLARLRQSLTA